MSTRLGSKNKKWSKETKDFAILLRKKGLTYGEIVNQLKVSKSTLFTWIGSIKRPVRELKLEREAHMRRIQGLAALANRKRRTDRLEEIRKNVQKEVDKYDVSDKDYLRSLLSMLYWAEGSKGRGQVEFANTDPVLSVLFVTLLRKSYKIDEERLHVRLHLHYYHKIKETRKIWSELLKIPESKFGKIYIKKRSKTRKFRQNFAGICFIKYYSESLRFEILERARLISQKIVPVA